jgi:HPt (histidine-containing phosphotransfer) domain-containing protein
MTIQELYEQIGGNYDHAMQIMRMDKMIAKYLQKLTDSDVCAALKAAGESMDPAALFESAHAMKGVCANLGLDSLASAVGEITEEFRPGADRKFTDEDIKAKLEEIYAMFDKTVEGIKEL